MEMLQYSTLLGGRGRPVAIYLIFFISLRVGAPTRHAVYTSLLIIKKMEMFHSIGSPPFPPTCLTELMYTQLHTLYTQTITKDAYPIALSLSSLSLYTLLSLFLPLSPPSTVM